MFIDREHACEKAGIKYGRGRERGGERIPNRLLTVSEEPSVGLKSLEL